MPLVDNAFYVDSVGYTAVTGWAAATVTAAGAMRRQTAAPSVGNERVFICIVAGTTHATTEPTWTVTRGAKNTDNTVTWQECTGQSAVNGDVTNTPNWTTLKNTAIVLGQIIKNDAATHYFICSTAGTAGNGAEPSWGTTAGNTTADGGATWTCIGAVGSFTGNQAPFARIASAIATNWGQPGNTIFVKSSHAETQSTSLTLAGTGTQANPMNVLCHNGAAYPPLAANITTGATVTCSAASSALLINPFSIYFEGIEFIQSGNNGSVTVGGNTVDAVLKNCKLTNSANSSTGAINIGSGSAASSRIRLDNVALTFGHASQSAVIVSDVEWVNTPNAILGATLPTTVFRFGTNPAITYLTCRGVDFSVLDSGKTLFPAANWHGFVKLINCKLGASVTVAGSPTLGGVIDVINCDDSDNFRNERYDYRGTMTTESTIVLAGGASDGTTPVSWKIVTTANPKVFRPFETPPIVAWNEDVGSPLTLTLQGIWGGGAVPNDDEIWVDVEYLGASDSPLSSRVHDGPANVLTPGAAQAAGAGTWGGSTTKFKLETTFTPEKKGFICARVKVAKISSTFYIDPKIVLAA